MELMAERARISRTTLTKVEKGDESVALGIYASVLHALGLVESLAKLADPISDEIGRAIDERSLPKRIRLPRSGPRRSTDTGDSDG
jgi:transcriptional regulator with XRE-family HTH domain